MKIDINDKKFATAKRRGYLFGYINNLEGWEDTFVGRWVSKYPQLTKCLDIICATIGNDAPVWEDFTDKNIKAIAEAISENVTSNSAKTYFATIKAVLNDANYEFAIPCKRYADILKAKKEPSQHTFLNEEELSLLADTITKNEREQYVKCLFLISAYTGARHSDALTFSKDNIANGCISYVSQKTRIEANIPVHSRLVEMLEGYDRNVKMYDYEYNDIIRDLCKRAGINERIKMFVSGKEKVGEKWEFISSHCARRSTATNLYLRGADIKTISQVLGHTNTAMTEKYIVVAKGLDLKAMQFFAA